MKTSLRDIVSEKNPSCRTICTAEQQCPNWSPCFSPCPPKIYSQYGRPIILHKCKSDCATLLLKILQRLLIKVLTNEALCDMICTLTTHFLSLSPFITWLQPHCPPCCLSDMDPRSLAHVINVPRKGFSQTFKR